MCPLCGKEYDSLSGLKVHFRTVHLTNGTCPVCGKHFRNVTKHFYRKALETNSAFFKALYFLAKERRPRCAYYREIRGEVIAFLSNGGWWFEDQDFGRV